MCIFNFKILSGTYLALIVLSFVWSKLVVGREIAQCKCFSALHTYIVFSTEYICFRQAERMKLLGNMKAIPDDSQRCRKHEEQTY